MISTVYNEFSWLPWKFFSVPEGFWGDIENQRKFLEIFAKENNLKNMEDWYNVTERDIQSFGGK